MGEFNDDELLEKLDLAFECMVDSAKNQFPEDEPMLRRAHDQIRLILENKKMAEPSEEWINEKHEEWVDGYWKLPSRVGVVLFEYTKNFIRSLLKESPMSLVPKDWLPTAENVNALPEPVRKYIHELATNCDPPSLVQENAILKENCKALEMTKKPKVSREEIKNVVDNLAKIREETKSSALNHEALFFEHWLRKKDVEVEEWLS